MKKININHFEQIFMVSEKIIIFESKYSSGPLDMEHIHENKNHFVSGPKFLIIILQYEPNMMEHQLSGIPMN